MGFKWKCPECGAENKYSGSLEKEANSQCSQCKKKLRIYKYKITNVDNQQKSTLTINTKKDNLEPFTGSSVDYQHIINKNQHKSTEIVDKSTNHHYPHIVYVALKHYKRTWFKNNQPDKEGKMLDEWNEMEEILEHE